MNVREQIAAIEAALRGIVDRNVTYWSDAGEVRLCFDSMADAMAKFKAARAALAQLDERIEK